MILAFQKHHNLRHVSIYIYIMTSRFSTANACNGRFLQFSLLCTSTWPPTSTNLPKVKIIFQPFTSLKNVRFLMDGKDMLYHFLEFVQFWVGKYFAPIFLRHNDFERKEIFVKDRLGPKPQNDESHYIKSFLYTQKIPKGTVPQLPIFLRCGNCIIIFNENSFLNSRDFPQSCPLRVSSQCIDNFFHFDDSIQCEICLMYSQGIMLILSAFCWSPNLLTQ